MDEWKGVGSMKVVAPDIKLGGIDQHHKIIWNGLQAHFYSSPGNTQPNADDPQATPITRSILGPVDLTNYMGLPLGSGKWSQEVGWYIQNWSVNMIGYIKFPAAGYYTVEAVSDDGVRFSVGGTANVGSGWVTQGATRYSTAVMGLAEDDLIQPLWLNHFQGTGGQRLQLTWSRWTDGTGTTPYTGWTQYTTIPAANLGYDWPMWFPVGMSHFMNGTPTSMAGTYVNSWKPYNERYSPSVRVLPGGEVNYVGLIRSGTVGGNVIALPSALRTGHYGRIYAGPSPVTTAIDTDVRVNGNYIQVISGSNSWVSLASIRYHVDVSDPRYLPYFATA